jgi:uncharacterized protein GlcG (DUF336 family)
VFPGAGGLPILADGQVVGGIAASGATVSPFFPKSVPPERLIADGQPANPEDLLIAYAMDIPYVGQHGDDLEKWRRTFGEWPEEPPTGLGLAAAPRASQQAELAQAIRLSDAVLEEAARRDLLVSVAVVDRYGDPIQQDGMAGSPTAAGYLAPALAAAAAAFETPSETVGERYPAATLERLLPYPVATAPGGLPLPGFGGLGVAGPDPSLAAEIALAALEALQ